MNVDSALPPAGMGRMQTQIYYSPRAAVEGGPDSKDARSRAATFRPTKPKQDENARGDPASGHPRRDSLLDGHRSSIDNAESEQGSVNEIIVKIEMKKFQNLINNRLKRKNNLVNQDVKRLYPLNKIADGTAKVAEAPTSFTEGLAKFNPLLCIKRGQSNQRSRMRTRRAVDALGVAESEASPQFKGQTQTSAE